MRQPFGNREVTTTRTPTIVAACAALALLPLAACTGESPVDAPAPAGPPSAAPPASSPYPLPELDTGAVYAWVETDAEDTATAEATAVGDAVSAWAASWPAEALFTLVTHADPVEPGMSSRVAEPLTPDNRHEVKRAERRLDHWIDESPIGRVEPTGYVQPVYTGGDLMIDADGDGNAYGVSVTVVPAGGYAPGYGPYRSSRNHATYAPHLVAGCADHSGGEGVTARVIHFACEERTTGDGLRVLLATETVERAAGETISSDRTTLVLYRADGTAVVVHGRFGVMDDLSVKPPAGAVPDLTVDDLVTLAESVPAVAVR